MSSGRPHGKILNQSTPVANSKKLQSYFPKGTVTESVGGEVLEKLTVALQNVRSLRRALESCEEEKAVVMAKNEKVLSENSRLYSQVTSLRARVHDLESSLSASTRAATFREPVSSDINGSASKSAISSDSAQKIAHLESQLFLFKRFADEQSRSHQETCTALEAKITRLESERLQLVKDLDQAQQFLKNHRLMAESDYPVDGSSQALVRLDQMQREVITLKRERESIKKVLTMALLVIDRESKLKTEISQKDCIIEDLQLQLSLSRSESGDRHWADKKQTSDRDSLSAAQPNIVFQSISTSAVIDSNVKPDQDYECAILGGISNRKTSSDSIQSRLAAIQESNSRLLDFLHLKSQS